MRSKHRRYTLVKLKYTLKHAIMLFTLSLQPVYLKYLSSYLCSMNFKKSVSSNK